MRNVAGGRFAAPTDTPVGGTVHPNGLYSLRPRNGTQAVPYGFAGWYIFKLTYSKTDTSDLNNCQL